MPKTLHPKTCAFDCEWIPCADTALRLLDLASDVSEADTFDAVFRSYDTARGETSLSLIGIDLQNQINFSVIKRKR